MVLMIDFHNLKGKIKQSIISRRDTLSPFDHPNDWALFTLALSNDGKKNNPLFEESLDKLSKWAFSEGSESQERYLSPLSLCGYLIEDYQKRDLIINKVLKKLDILLSKDSDKFSVLNDPVQIFYLTLGAKEKLSEKQKGTIIDLCSKNFNKGRTSRKVFYTACLLELNQELNIQPSIDKTITDPSDIISILWFYEHHKSRYKRQTDDLWEKFFNILDTFAFEYPHEESSILSISNLDLSLLYEAVLKQTKSPDPMLLFNIYPLHPKVKASAKSLFEKGEYSNAVFEATKTFNEFIREKTGLGDSETTLMLKAMGDPSSKNIENPKIKFNPLDPNSTDYKSQQNEQRGLSHIAQGIFFAFRHPKGHETKERWPLDPYAALDQLVTISYIMKRVDEAANGTFK